MRKVEEAEEYLRSLDLYNVRVRLHDDIGRIEVDEDGLETIISNKKDIISFFKTKGIEYVTIDLEGFRSGSMDYKVKK